MKSYNLEVIDASTILHELFGEDTDSFDQIIDEMTIAEWTYGTNAYSLIHIDDFMEFLMDCADNEICQALTRDKIEQVWHRNPFQWEIQSKIENGKGVDVYVNLEMR